MTTRHRSSRSLLPEAVAIGLLVAVASYTIAFLAVPTARHRLIVEDGIIETTTAFVFLGGAIVGTVGMLLNRTRRLYWLVPVFGLLGFLDEMKFGARIFGFDPPVIDAVAVDSFHDALIVAADFVAGRGLTILAIIIGSALVGLGAVTLLRSGRYLRAGAWLADHVPIALLIGAIGFLAVGVLFDQLGASTPIRFGEEIAEFIAAGLVAIAATAVLTRRPPQPSPLDALPGKPA